MEVIRTVTSPQSALCPSCNSHIVVLSPADLPPGQEYATIQHQPGCAWLRQTIVPDLTFLLDLLRHRQTLTLIVPVARETV
jgi:hypothetical protein